MRRGIPPLRELSASFQLSNALLLLNLDSRTSEPERAA